MSKNNMPMPQSSKGVAEVKQPEIQSAKPSGIEVVATRAGFFDMQRRKEGDVFLVPNFDKMGLWMKCTNPESEAKRLKMLKEKKDKQRSGK